MTELAGVVAVMRQQTSELNNLHARRPRTQGVQSIERTDQFDAVGMQSSSLLIELWPVYVTVEYRQCCA